MNTTTITKLLTSAKKYEEIRQEIKDGIADLNPVEIVTPTNVKQEKEKWLERAKDGKFEDPEFLYDESLLEHVMEKKEELKEIEDKLKDVESPESVADQFVLDELSLALSDGIDTTCLAEAIRLGVDEYAARIIQDKYGIPESISIIDAREIILNNKIKDKFEHSISQAHPYPNLDLLTTKKLKAAEIKEMFEWVMRAYDAKKVWPVEILGNCTSIDVRDKSVAGHPIIAIPTKRKVTGMKLAELIGHEIECHWRSSVNAELIGALKCDDELVYEGLAALKDKEFNRRYLETFNLNSAYYIVAIDMALKGCSFSRTAENLLNYIPESLGKEECLKKAWMYTYRIFRGISNTSNPEKYAFTKDRAYFEGYQYARALQEKGKGDYLSFSTLSKTCFEKLMEILDLEDIRKYAVLDRGMQEKSLEMILRRLSYISPT